ncbi:MAG: IMP cyclohydrolase [Armatimonadetes bacterium RBG_16_58_9]|nr:MAG: IMP cyclohydrolase [Armatimonadetes bacterium RBG_16_58_9]
MYVGRIVAVGKTSRPFVAYRVSSRSFPNRIARITEIGAAIQPLDPEDMKKNPYIAYNCIRISRNGVVVSNGSHTDPIFEKLEAGEHPDVAIQQVLEEMGYEKDELNTPRIAGVVTDNLGLVGIVRADGIEVSSFDLEDNSCHVICTYEMDRVESKSHPFLAESAEKAARYVVDGGMFADLEKPICAAAWMGELAVYNPHQ